MAWKKIKGGAGSSKKAKQSSTDSDKAKATTDSSDKGNVASTSCDKIDTAVPLCQDKLGPVDGNGNGNGNGNGGGGGKVEMAYIGTENDAGDDGKIYKVNLEDMTLENTINLTESREHNLIHAVVDEDGSFAYFKNQDTGGSSEAKYLKVNTATDAVTRLTISNPLGGFPHGGVGMMAMDTTNNVLWSIVTSTGASAGFGLVKIDLDTFTVTSQTHMGVRGTCCGIDIENQLLYVGATTAGSQFPSLFKIDLTTPVISDTITLTAATSTGGDDIQNIVVESDLQYTFNTSNSSPENIVRNRIDSSFDVSNCDNLEMNFNVAANRDPRPGLVLNNSGTRLYVPTRSSGTAAYITEVDTSTFNSLRDSPGVGGVDGDLTELLINPEGTYVWGLSQLGFLYKLDINEFDYTSNSPLQLPGQERLTCGVRWTKIVNP